MPVSSYYQGGARNVGAPIAGEFLARYFATIKGMNDADRASSGAESAKDLAELEAEARTRMGQLASTLAEVRNGDTRSYNDLLKTLMQTASAEKQTADRMNTSIAMKRLDILRGYREQAATEAEKLGKAITFSEEATEKFSNYGRNTHEDPDTAAERYISDAQHENAGVMGSAKFDHGAGKVYDSLRRNKGTEYADEFARSLGYEGDPNVYFAQVHAPTTYESATEDAWDSIRRVGGGASGGGGSRAALASAGVSPTDLEAGGYSTSTRTKSPTAGSSTGRPVSVGVAAKGLSPVALQAMSGESDPYKALQAAIEAQADYADDLARRREAASRGGGMYPRANEYTVSPNRISLAPVPRPAHPPATSPTPTTIKMSGTTVPERDPDVIGGTTSFEDRTDPSEAWKWRNPAPAPKLEPQSVKGTRFDPGSTQFIYDAIGAGRSEADEFDAFTPSPDTDADEFDAFKETK